MATLQCMVGAQGVCLSLDNMSSIEFQQYQTRNFYATNIRTWLSNDAGATWSEVTASVIGRPPTLIHVPGGVDTMYEPMWVNPHWFHNKWRWWVGGLDAVDSYMIRVDVGTTTTLASATVSFTTTDYETVQFNIDSTVSSEAQEKLTDTTDILQDYFNYAGVKFTGSEVGGMKWSYDENMEGTAECSGTFGTISLGTFSINWLLGNASYFNVSCHEMLHYFGIDNHGGRIEAGDRVNFFTDSNNYIDVSTSADPINQPSKRDPNPPSGYYRYRYSNSCLDDVFKFVQGTTDSRVIRFLDHCNVSEATNNNFEVFFIYRALLFDDVTIVSATM